MGRFPCPTPDICGVSYHLKENACVGKRTLDMLAARGLEIPPDISTKPLVTIDESGFWSSPSSPAPSISEQLWSRDGYMSDGAMKQWLKWFDKDGRVSQVLHRTDGGPAVEVWSSDYHGGEEIAHQSWHQDGELHREGGPALIEWRYDDGVGPSKIVEEWWVDGRCHREDGPARMYWKTNLQEPTYGVVGGESRALPFREPVYEEKGYDPDWDPETDVDYIFEEGGSPVVQEFWLFGQKVTADEFAFFREMKASGSDMPEGWFLEFLNGQRS